MAFRLFHLFPGLGGLLGKAQKSAANSLYADIVEQARSPRFYRELGVPDTVEGRFDLIAVHMFLVLRRLKGEAAAGTLGQRLFNTMFDDMDASLREMGVGDTRVPKEVRAMGEDFAGRVKGYEAGVEVKAFLADALALNVYDRPDGTGGEALADYVTVADKLLCEQSTEDLITGRVSFPDPLHVGEVSHE